MGRETNTIFGLDNYNYGVKDFGVEDYTQTYVLPFNFVDYNVGRVPCTIGLGGLGTNYVGHMGVGVYYNTICRGKGNFVYFNGVNVYRLNIAMGEVDRCLFAIYVNMVDRVRCTILGGYKDFGIYGI